jgi:small subunit ribosomal protein S2e
LNAIEKFSVDVLAAFASSRKGREAFVSRDFRARVEVFFFLSLRRGLFEGFFPRAERVFRSKCPPGFIDANISCSPIHFHFTLTHTQGKIKSLEQIYLHSIPIKEYQIVDYFIGANLVDEVMKIMPVQKQTSAGQRMRFKAFVVVGDSNGHIGLGVKACKEVAHSIQGSMILAKLNMVPVRRGYWGAALGAPHTVPTKVHGKCGSVHIRLIPAPKGSGVVAAQTPKKVLVMAGIHDVYTCSRGHTRTLGNFVKATYFALRSTYEFLTPDLWAENKWQKAPAQEYTDFLSAPPKKVRHYDDY